MVAYLAPMRQPQFPGECGPLEQQIQNLGWLEWEPNFGESLKKPLKVRDKC